MDGALPRTPERRMPRTLKSRLARRWLNAVACRRTKQLLGGYFNAAKPVGVAKFPERPSRVQLYVSPNGFKLPRIKRKLDIAIAVKDPSWLRTLFAAAPSRRFGRDGLGAFASDPTTLGRFFVKSADGVFETHDWKSFRLMGLPGASEGKIACDALGRVLVCRVRTGDLKTRGLWRCNPSGGEWVRLHDDPLACAVASDPKDPTRLVLTTSDNPYHDFSGANGVYVSSNDGKTWGPANEGLHVRRLACVAFDPFDGETLVAGTLGGGFVKATWSRSTDTR